MGLPGCKANLSINLSSFPPTSHPSPHFIIDLPLSSSPGNSGFVTTLLLVGWATLTVYSEWFRWLTGLTLSNDGRYMLSPPINSPPSPPPQSACYLVCSLWAPLMFPCSQHYLYHSYVVRHPPVSQHSLCVFWLFVVLKCQEPNTQWRSVTSQKNVYFIHSATKTLNLLRLLQYEAGNKAFLIHLKLFFLLILNTLRTGNENSRH
jgi:hypothetical protein